MTPLRRMFLISACLPFALSAEILTVSPAADETLSALPSVMKEFLRLPRAERRAYFLNQTKRDVLFQNRDAVPFTFRWKCTAGETGTFRAVFAADPEFRNLLPVYVYPAGKDGASIRAVNFPIGAECWWKIVCRTADGRESASEAAKFRTEDFVPRFLRLDNVGNVRDLGGRRGLGGKRVRTGMIFRSAGLNENSPDFAADPKGLKKPFSKFRVGKNRITPAFADYVNRTKLFRTELDLRYAGEVATMKQSPLGPGVRWINHPSACYGEIFRKDGMAAMAKNFRVFCDPANYPVNFHCIAGADRTGALGFVLNGVLGVDPDELEKDWEISAWNYFRFEGMYDDLAKGFEAYGAKGDPLSAKIGKYLIACGVTEAEIAKFRSIMLK